MYMLILLDIDGVMLSAKSWERPELLEDGFPAFSLKAIRVLKNFVDEKTTIVLTTSHKSKFSIEEWKSIFELRGVIIQNLKVLNENIKELNRKDEILNWFNLNDVNEDFVIIDDDTSLNDLPAFLKDRLLLTSPFIGLIDSHLEQINKMLHKKPSKV